MGGIFINIDFSLFKKDHKILLNIFICLSFLLLSFLSSYLLLRNHSLYVGNDLQFNFKRILELAESIKNDNLLPNYSFNQLHGSSVMTLYPYLNLYPLALLSLFIKSKITLVYSIFIFHTLLCFIFSFYSSKNYIGFYKTSYVFSIIYSLSNTFLSYNLIGYDFGIISTYILLPLIIFSFMEIINGYNSWLQLSIGISLLLYSHIINVFIICIFLLIILMININKHVLINLFKAILFFVILTSAFWIPFIHLYFNNINNIDMPYVKQLDNIPLKNFMSGIYGSKSTLTIGFFPILSMIISLLFYKKFNKDIKQIYLISLFISLSTLFLPWKLITSHGIFTILNQLQYTWRLLIVPQMTFAFIFALIITRYLNKSIVNVICISVVLFSILFQIFIGQYVMIKQFSHNPSINYIIKNNKNIIGDDVFGYRINNTSQFNILLNSYDSEYDDYIPKSAFYSSSCVNRNIGLYDNHKIKLSNIGYNKLEFSVKNDANKLVLPIYIYNKEKLYVYLNGKIINNYSNNSGLITLNNVKNNVKSHNEVYIMTYPNIFRIIGVILSTLGWLFILVIVIKKFLFK